MKKLLSFLLFLSTFSIFADDDDWFRQLPDQKFTSKITSTIFPNMDAVIIIKEQALTMQTSSVFYKGIEFEGPAVILTNCIIVKLLTESAVHRYGSFEYIYQEYFGDEIPVGFMVRARVQKEDGDIFEVDEDEIQKLVSIEDNDGSPLERKVIFKIPNLSIGDVVQIEYQHNEPFSYSYSGMFYFNAKDFVLYSNAYLTVPVNFEFETYNFPETVIPEPTIEQISRSFGAGQTYFWSVKNLNSIPDEPYSQPFEDQSLFTAFVIKKIDHVKIGSWEVICKKFYEKYLDDLDTDLDDLKPLNLGNRPDSITFNHIDSLYSRIKRYFKLTSTNSIYPSLNLDKLVEHKKGNASDLAFILLTVLNVWQQEVQVALIRDKREGAFEESVASLYWFNRLGVLVKINNEEKLYDFDFAVSNNYKYPWFLNGINLFILENETGTLKSFKFQNTASNNSLVERHTFALNDNDEVFDSTFISFNGCWVDNYREQFYGNDPREIKNYFMMELKDKCHSTIDTLTVNDMFNDYSAELYLYGKSLSTYEAIDSFFVIKIKSYIFKKLKDQLITTKRKNHIFFNAPFSYLYDCDITIPDGYTLSNGEERRSIGSGFNATFDINCSIVNNKLKVSAKMDFPISQFSIDKFSELISFLDNSIKQLDKDIVLKKISK